MKCPVCNNDIDIFYLEECIEKYKDAVCSKCNTILDIGIDYRICNEDGDEQIFIDELTIKK